MVHPPLPSGYTFEAELSRPAEGVCVLRATFEGEARVVRIDAGDDGRQQRAELAVLAAVDHPGLARLLDHGVLPDGGGSFVARSWIEGRELSEWAAGRSAEEIGGVVARLTPALAHLHRRGFVHADLKAANVIVSDAGEPILTDFGLSRRADDERGGVSGTLFGIAPEVLLGAEADARSDLFAVGVLLHELLVRRRCSAAEFYGRFPREDYFRASGTAAEELPDWARDVVVSLVELDPDRRPATAEQLGRQLAGRLGVDGLFRQDERVELGWPVRTGRAGWIERWSQGVRAVKKDGLQWLRFPPREDPRVLMDELALVATLDGSSVHRLDLGAELGRLTNDVALDRWARRTCGERAGVILLAPLPAAAPWARRGVAALARTLRQERNAGEANPAVLVVGSEDAPAGPAADVAWEESEVPAVEVEALREHLSAHLDGEAAALEALAERLSEAADGSATRLDDLLTAGSHAGWFVPGDERPRLRPGALPELHAEDSDQVHDVAGDAAQLLAALHVLGGSASLAEAGALAELDGAALARAVQDLRGVGLVGSRREGTETRLERAPVALPDVRGWPAETVWQRMHADRAAALKAAGAGATDVLPHEWRAELAETDDVLATSEEQLDRGCPELALQLLDAVEAQAREAGRELDPRISTERALAWCALGQGFRAQEELDAIETAPGGAGALAERVRAQIASLEHDPTRALAHLQRAVELDPSEAGEVALARARVLYGLGRDDEVIELAGELRAGGASDKLRPRSWANLRAIEAMSRFRRGEVDAARDALAEQAAEAAGDPGREAGLRINLATVERRSGDPARAVAHLELAVEHYQSAGRLPGLSQARAMLGSLLRDLGDLEQAERLLGSARAIRERQGDRTGAAATQGMLGLVHADRGHARAAVQELENAARKLREGGRSRDAILLEVRACEVRARLGEPPSEAVQSELNRLGEGDPRVLVSLARAAWIHGDLRRAQELAARAVELADGLGLTSVRDEGAFVARRLEGAGAEASHEAGEETLVAEDDRVLALLSTAPFDFDAALELAQSLERRGRDDRAARVLVACAARTTVTGEASDFVERAEHAFERCAPGLSPVEASALRRSLLGMPDPWPEDLLTVDRRRSGDEEHEMEVIKLLEINHRLVTHEDLASLLGTIVEQALSVSGAQRGFLILEEDGELIVDTALDSRRGGIEAPDVEVSGSVLERALEGMRPIRVSNAVDDPLLGSAPSVVSLELRSILCAPFEVQRGLRGVIYVDHRLREAAFDERVERLLALLADQAALAIQQVRRMQEIRELNRALHKRVARQESDLATARQRLRVVGLPTPSGGLVGDSPPMRAVHSLIERAAGTDLAVLVVGESGTGKELAARALHDLGPRRDGPFVSENCAAIPSSLIESELFGTSRGAFTGADRDRPGLFERAHGGTLFLDEIGELPIELQAKLLRVLETMQVRRIGDSKMRDVDFRLVAATNRDLQQEIGAERFRADLYYRLDGLSVRMPPLRDHAEDIPALVEHALRTQAAPGEPPRPISKAVMTRLCRRDWPGNVRELFNEVSRLCVLSEGEIDDPEVVRLPQVIGTTAAADGSVRTLAAIEREAIENALSTCGGDKRKAAEMLGISRAKVYQRLKEWADTEQAAP